jgi:type II secretory pathway component PulF
MKSDEFAFFNQQLAAMLRDGIPLEGALRRLCSEMGRGRLRDELQLLETDLARGTPMADALAPRQLPELYKRMILIGVKGGDLPGALMMLADYFERRHLLETRMKGLMVYPLIVLFVAFALSCFLAYLLGTFIWKNLEFLAGSPTPGSVSAALWMTPVIFGLVLAAIVFAIAVSPARRNLRWRLPAFKESSLAQVASAMWLMLKNGVPLGEALAVMEQLEHGTRAEREIARWRQRLAAGHGKFSEMAADTEATVSVFPPLFVWAIAQSGEDLTAGFQRAAELYQARAMYRTELLLYSALPCSILALSAMIISQVQPVFAVLISYIRMLSDTGD